MTFIHKKREQILCYADRYRQTPHSHNKYAHAYREHLLSVIGECRYNLAIFSAPKQKQTLKFNLMS